jgi:hypothetical protein
LKLPNIDAVVVLTANLSDYLLSTTHPKGRHKAAFFLQFGFRADAPDAMAAALVQLAWKHDIVRVDSSPFGMRYVVEGALETPDGRNPMVRTVWFVETDEVVPRFVSAYPLKGLRP